MKMIHDLIILIALIVLSLSCTRQVFDEQKWQEKVNATKKEDLYLKNKKDGEFYNPWMPMVQKSFWGVLGWKLSKKNNSYTEYEENYLPLIKKDTYEKLLLYKNKNYILWIGHNTFLVKVDDQFFITDPIFSERAFLPKRVTPPAITIKQLNEIAKKLIIIITHNHYDHLDEDSIEQISKTAKVIVPLGLKKLMLKLNKTDIIEMDWWQEYTCNKQKKIYCLPAQHWSRRLTQSFNTTLWASYMLIAGKHKIYIGGDSGYFIGYKEFAAKFKNIDYAFLPVTAYHPRWFMYYAHVNIQEAIQAFVDLKAKCFVPTQWGTFRLGDNPPGYPALELKREIEKRSLEKNKYKIMHLGEIIEIK